MLNKKVHARKKRRHEVGFKLWTLWLTALVQKHQAQEALMFLNIH